MALTKGQKTATGNSSPTSGSGGNDVIVTSCQTSGSGVTEYRGILQPMDRFPREVADKRRSYPPHEDCNIAVETDSSILKSQKLRGRDSSCHECASKNTQPLMNWAHFAAVLLLFGFLGLCQYQMWTVRGEVDELRQQCGAVRHLYALQQNQQLHQQQKQQQELQFQQQYYRDQHQQNAMWMDDDETEEEEQYEEQELSIFWQERQKGDVGSVGRDLDHPDDEDGVMQTNPDSDVTSGKDVIRRVARNTDEVRKIRHNRGSGQDKGKTKGTKGRRNNKKGGREKVKIPKTPKRNKKRAVQLTAEQPDTSDRDREFLNEHPTNNVTKNGMIIFKHGVRFIDGVMKSWKVGKEFEISKGPVWYTYHPTTGELEIKETGTYYVYAQVLYVHYHNAAVQSCHGIHKKTGDDDVTLFKCLQSVDWVNNTTSDTAVNRKHKTCYTGGIAWLRNNDRLYVKDEYVGEPGKAMSLGKESTFWGMFKIG